MTEQPFEAEIVEDSQASVVSPSALEAITRAEVDVAISTAKRYPRNLEQWKAQTLAAATSTQDIAESCSYYLERKNADGTKKSIEGPSIRLIELAMTYFKNTRWAGRVVGEDDNYVHAQGIVHDLENNTLVTQEVARKITGKTGRRFSADMVAVTGAAAVSIAMRNAARRVLPQVTIEAIRLKAKALAAGDAKTVTQRWDSAAKFFQTQFAITSAMLLKKLGRERIEDVQPEDIGKLNGLRTALRDGMTSIADEFPAEKAEDVAGETKLETAPENSAPAASQTAPDKTADELEKKKRGRPKKTEGAASPESGVLVDNREELLENVKRFLSKTFNTGAAIDDAIRKGAKYADYQAFAAGATAEEIAKFYALIQKAVIETPKPTAVKTDDEAPETDETETAPEPDEPEEKAKEDPAWLARAVGKAPKDPDTATMFLRVLKGFEILGFNESRARLEMKYATAGSVQTIDQLVGATADQLKAVHRHLMAIG
jgi:hypothetical protein